MAQQTLGVGQEFWFPPYPQGASQALNASTFLMDASGEYVSLVLCAPMAGTIDKFGTFLAAVGNAPDNGLRFSMQGVDLSTGLPDGVVDQFATVASGSVTTGWLDPGAFDTSRTVTRGELFACVVDFPTFVAADSVTVQGMVLGGGGSFEGFPYGTSITGTKSAAAIPQIYLHYTDGGGLWVPASTQMWPYSSVATQTLDVDTTPDEIGLAFTLPYRATLDRVQIALNTVSAASNFDLVLYDSGGTPLATSSHDGDVTQVANVVRVFELLLASAVELTPGSLYRLIIKPSTTNNVNIQYGVVPSDLFAAAPGAGEFYLTQRTNAGAWTDFNNGSDGYRLPTIALGFSAGSDGAGGCGAGMLLRGVGQEEEDPQMLAGLGLSALGLGAALVASPRKFTRRKLFGRRDKT